MPLIFSTALKEITDRAGHQKSICFNVCLQQITHQFYTALSMQGLVRPCDDIKVSAEKGLSVMEALFESISESDRFFIHLAESENLKNLITTPDAVPISDTLKKVEHWLKSDAVKCFNLKTKNLNADALLQYLDYMTRAYISCHRDIAEQTIRAVLQPTIRGQP